MQIRFFVIEKESIVFAKTYNAAIPLKSNDAQSIVQALDRCLKEVLNALDNDLATAAL